MSGGTTGPKGTAQLAMEFAAGVDLSREVGPSPPGRARIRYNALTGQLEASVDGAAYTPLATGGGSSPWLEAGGVVRLQNITWDVVIGAATTVGTEKLRVVGDIRVDSTVFVSALSTSAGDLAVGSNSGRIGMTIGGVAADAFHVSDGVGPLVSADLSGGTRDVIVGLAGAVVDSTQLHNTRTELTLGADSSAFQVQDATETYMLLNTALGTEALTFGDNAKVVAGLSLSGASATLTAPDNSATAARIVEGLNAYLVVDTTNGSESLSLGNALTDVDVSMKDNSALAFAIKQGANNYLSVDTTDTTEQLTLGNTTTNPDVVFDTGGDIVFPNSALCLAELGADPAAVANTVKLYAKDVATVSQLFARSDDGTVHQLTPVSSASPGGANTNVQYNNLGAFGGDANFTYDGAGLVSVGSGLTTTAAGALALGTTVATSINIGSAIAATSIAVQDNVDPAFEIVQGANNWLGIETTNGGEGIQFGANAFNPYYLFAGGTSATRMTVGSDGIGRINVTNITPSAGEVSHDINIGQGATALDVNIGLSTQACVIDSGDVQITTGPVSMTQLAGDPGGVASTGRVYTKLIAGGTELFYEDAASNVVQITSAGAVNATATPAGANTQVQYNNAGAFGASAGFTFTTAGGGTLTLGGGLNVGTTGASTGQIATSSTIFAGGSVFTAGGAFDKTGGGALNFGANAGSVTIAASSVTTTIQGPVSAGGNAGADFTYNGGGITRWVIPDNNSAAYKIDQAGSIYLLIDTTNAAETVSFCAPAGIGVSLSILTSGGALGFFGTSATAQYSTTGTTTGFSVGVGTGVNDDSTFTGNTGATAYTIGDIVRALKLYGLMAA